MMDQKTNRVTTSGFRPWGVARALVCACAVAIAAAGCSFDSYEVPSDPAKRREALFYESMHGTADHVEALLKAGEKADSRDLLGWTPLHYAINRWRDKSYHDVRPVELLLAAPDVDANSTTNDGTTPIQLAARNGASEIVDLLLDAGVDPDQHDDAGLTPLMEAVKSNRLEAARHLLDRGANVDERLPSGGTALFVAIRGRNPDAVRLLIERGAKVRGNEKAADPIIFAAAMKNEEVVELLIRAGADVNAVNRINGLTPLHRAVTSGAGMVKLLLDAGARPGISDQEGQTPLDLARERGDEDTIALLSAAS